VALVLHNLAITARPVDQRHETRRGEDVIDARVETTGARLEVWSVYSVVINIYVYMLMLINISW
jgi:hypothetical protein